MDNDEDLGSLGLLMRLPPAVMQMWCISVFFKLMFQKKML